MSPTCHLGRPEGRPLRRNRSRATWRSAPTPAW